MANASPSPAGTGAGRLIPAFRSLPPGAQQPIDAAVLELTPAGQDPVAGTLDAFVSRPRADATRSMTPTSALAPYLAMLAEAPPPPVAVSVDGQTFELSADPEDLAELLHVRYVLSGWDGVNAFFAPIERLKNAARQEADAARRALEEARRWLNPSGGTPERTLEAGANLPRLEREAADAAARAASVITHLDRVGDELRKQRDLLTERLDTLLEFFYVEARAELRQLLATSEATVRKEVAEYGVKVAESSDKAQLADNDATKKLRDALKKLAAQREAVKTAQLMVLGTKIESGALNFALLIAIWEEINHGESVTLPGLMNHPLYRQVSEDARLADQDLLNAQNDYATMRATLGREQPIIFRIAERVDDTAAPDDVARAIHLGANGILESIRQTRERSQLEQGDRPFVHARDALIRLYLDPAARVAYSAKDMVEVWRMPGVVRRTLERLGPHGVAFAPGEAGYVVVTRVLEKMESQREAREDFWNDVSLVLPFLAPATGGVSLVVLGVISATRALATLAEHNERLMLFNSTLDPALALTDDDPSSFWLLVELVSYGLDVLEAGRAVRSLAGPLSRRARLEALKSMTGRSRAAKKLVDAEEKLLKAEVARGLGEVDGRLPEASAQKVRQAVASGEKKAAGPTGGSATPSAEAGALKQPPSEARSKAKVPTKAAAAKAASDPRAARQLVESALAALKREVPDIARQLEELLTPQELQEIVSRVSGFDRPATREAYDGLLNVVQGELLERMVPRMPQFKEALQNAATRVGKAPGRWTEVRVSRIVDAPIASGARKKFSDFVFYAEGLDKDNEGFVLLLEFIEAKSGEASSLFRKVGPAGTKAAVGQLGRIEQRLRAVTWLDRKAVSFEKMVYVLPTAGLDDPLTKYSVVMQHPPSWEDVGTLVGEQRLNADVWLAPMATDKLRRSSDVLLRALNKAPEVKTATVPALPQVLPALGREAAGTAQER